MGIMRAHGDSIVKGVLLAHPSYAWPEIVAAHVGMPLTNTAVSGSMAYDQAVHVYQQTVASDDLSFIALGLNDAANWGGGGVRIPDYANAMAAMVAWLAIPDASKFRAKTSAIFTGAWTNTAVYGLGKVSRDNGAKASFTAPGPVVYIGMIRQSVSFGTCSIRRNGTEITTFDTGLNGSPNTFLGIGYGPALVRLSGLTAGDTIDVVVTSASGGSNWLYVDWFASPVAGPRVFVGTPTRKWIDGYNQTGGSDRLTMLYRRALLGRIQPLINDGLDISVVDMHRIINPAADLFARRPDNNAIDWVHWHEAGHEIGAEAYISAL